MKLTLSNRAVRVGLVLLLLLLIGTQIHYNYSRHQALINVSSSNDNPLDMSEINTNGKVPGEPTKGFAEAKLVYKDIQAYRDRHEGQFPPNGSALLDDRAEHHDAYGYPTLLSAIRAYCNPDARYADDPILRRSPSSAETFIILKHRPDGGEIGSNKPTETRDALAYSDLYYHENIHHHGTKGDTISPVGIFIVVWDDGQVQPIPFQRISYVRQADGFVPVFPGEAGVPSDAVPFKTFYSHILHP